MAHIHLQKVHKKVDLSDTPNYDGTCYDYSLTVTYYPSVYFKGVTTDFEQWLDDNIRKADLCDIWFIPECHCDSPWELAKSAFRGMTEEEREKAISAALEMEIADSREDVEKFFKEALESDTDNDTIFIEVW